MGYGKLWEVYGNYIWKYGVNFGDSSCDPHFISDRSFSGYDSPGRVKESPFKRSRNHMIGTLL